MRESILLVAEKQMVKIPDNCRAKIFWADTEKKFRSIMAVEKITAIIAEQNSKNRANLDSYPDNIPIILCKAEAIERHMNALCGIADADDGNLNDTRTLQFVAGELALSINHFLLNIITVVNLELDMLRMENQVSKDGDKRLDYIEEQVDLIVATIDSLRALKANTDDDEFPFDIKEETIKFLPLMKDYFMNHGVTLKSIVPENMPPVTVNRTALRILFISSILFLYHSKEENEKGLIAIELSETTDAIDVKIECPFTKYIKYLTGENIEYTGDLKQYSDTIKKYASRLNINIRAEQGGNTAYIAFKVKK